MTYPSRDTVVEYPAGAVTSSGKVVHTESLGEGRLAVVLDVTAAHPVDAAWPDQGADRGTLRVRGAEIALSGVSVAATDGSALFVGRDIPVRKGTDGWAFLVVHEVAASADVVEGDCAEVSVDPDYRRALSIGHSACHLASLALNAALADAWTKEVPSDAAGPPNFDALAIETSTIVEFGSDDVYRIGKSLRKKGFSASALSDGTAGIEADVNATLAAWASAGGPVAVVREGDGLTDRRFWQCELDGSAVSIPCGGTHASALEELSGIAVSLTLSDAAGALVLHMATRTRPVRV